VQPQWLTLPPQEEAEIRLRLPLLPELFAPSRQYHGKVLVQGYDELELILSITVDAAPEPATRVAAVVSPAAAPASEPAPEPPPPVAAKKRAAKRASRQGTKTARPRKPRRTKGDEPPGAA
jgi:hypothetical protein